VAAVGAAGAVVALRTAVLRWATGKGPATVGPRWLAIWLGSQLGRAAQIFGVDFETDTVERWHNDPNRSLDPDRQYLTCWHPHGALTFCAAMFTSKMAAQSTTDECPGPRNWFVGIATLLFRFPFIGEYLTLVNARPVTQKMSDELLAAGRSLALQPGGIPEQVATDHRREQLVFPPNLGFCRLAMKHGVPLLPIYAFGENQVFTTYEWGRQMTAKLFDSFGVSVPLVNPLPNKVTLHMKWGEPVELSKSTEAPEDHEVEKVFARYLVALGRLFGEHASSCLPPAVAAEGLSITWRGHSKDKLDKLLEAECQGSSVPSCLRTMDGIVRAAPRRSKL